MHLQKQGHIDGVDDPISIMVRVRVGAAFIDGLAQTFSDVARGVALTYIGSGEHLEVAVNGGRACDLLGIGIGGPVRAESRR